MKHYLTNFNIYLIKTLKMCKKETFLNKIKATYDKPTANIILNDERLKVFPHKTRNKTRMLTHYFQPNVVLKVLVTEMRQELKGIQTADNMILYIENPKDPSHTHTPKNKNKNIKTNKLIQ